MTADVRQGRCWSDGRMDELMLAAAPIAILVSAVV
jgi:hypothetical protein